MVQIPQSEMVSAKCFCGDLHVYLESLSWLDLTSCQIQLHFELKYPSNLAENMMPLIFTRDPELSATKQAQSSNDPPLYFIFNWFSLHAFPIISKHAGSYFQLNLIWPHHIVPPVAALSQA